MLEYTYAARLKEFDQFFIKYLIVNKKESWLMCTIKVPYGIATSWFIPEKEAVIRNCRSIAM